MIAKVDADLCIGYGLCEAGCSEVFVMNENNVAEVKVEVVPGAAEGSCREAAENCPVDAIIIEE